MGKLTSEMSTYRVREHNTTSQTKNKNKTLQRNTMNYEIKHTSNIQGTQKYQRLLLRGAIVNRTYGIHKNLYI